MIFPKRESNPAVLEKLVERIKVTNSENAQVPSNELAQRLHQQDLAEISERSKSKREIEQLRNWLADSRHKNAALRDAANAVLEHFMPSFPDSRAVDDCLVGLAAAVAGIESHSHETYERRLAEACERMRRAAALVAMAGDQSMALAIYDQSRRLLGDVKPWWDSENTQKASERRAYHANGTYWSGVPTVDMPCDFCGLAITAHDPRTHACPTVSEGDQRGEG